MTESILKSEKEGNYDWIIDLGNIKSLIEQHTGSFTYFPRALVSGCGTSLTSSLLVEYGVSMVISVDIEQGCIEHMRALHAPDTRMIWIQCDLNDSSSISSSQREGLQPSSFNLVFDKGTLDAILVEGTVHQYLANIYHLMAANSYYVLISLHRDDFFLPILSSPLFNFELIHFPLLSGGSVVVCKKSCEVRLDIEAIAALEELIMNSHFKDCNPLLHPSEIESLLHYFDGQALPLEDAYDAMFRSRSYLGYTFELFLEDLSNFQLQNEGTMTAHEAIEFIKAME